MNEWLESVEPLVYESRIKVPYTWSVGETGSRFLTELRDHGKILGTKCTECGVVYLPPRKHCGRCFSETLRWIELGLEGTLVTHTVVRYSSSVMPMKSPFAYGIILLDGADTGLVHLLGEVKFDDIRTGMRVEAVLREERIGDIMDIKYFRPIQ
ncbi:MAG: DNA-binding protein [Proteobacteria bacterium]|nr:DNA-binding protein [Pseudomonadota bacterium]